MTTKGESFALERLPFTVGQRYLIPMVMDDQPRVRGFLANALSSRRLGHALLFVGPPDAGQEDAARAVAAGLISGEASTDSSTPFGCGSCSACARVASGNHPDVHLVLSEAERVRRFGDSPDGKRPARDLKVEQIRELTRQLRMRPYEGKASVAIIPDAHRMNANAANALLKTLEEPPETTTLILLAPHERTLLPTIASRVQVLRFSPRPDVADAAPPDATEDAELAARVLDSLRAPATERMDLIEALGRDRDDAARLVDALEMRVAAQLRAQTLAAGADQAAPATLEASRLLRLADRLRDAREALLGNAHVQLTYEALLLPPL